MICVIVGPSGSGKSTFAKYICQFGGVEVISTTTREPRQHETDGVDYNFISKDQFHKLVEKDGFLEWAEFCGNFYGITKQALSDALSSSPQNCAVVVAEINGYRNLLKLSGKLGQYVMGVFLSIDRDTILSRLEKRNLPNKILEQRISLIGQEIKQEFELNQRQENLVLTNPSLSDMKEYARIIAQSSSKEVVPLFVLS
ncbi:hypothetical protein CSR02_14385 [Acetobacter pomorum]|uniref:Guanylate kinase-like domain-containing protein n=1 Tax=Acetobacter pomorum TaxID=65959 RepID=A0A2G4R8R6_9PROT|nr:AAA family ATPase [Acetobacter pomorum]PHY92897.1 hypothetical protein CSR02_14385 [Acetobacter pomorum]GBR54713.1 guanylate kinase [Acetobacter pomorum DSM 11825]